MRDRLIVVSVTVSPELAHQARMAAAQENISRSALIRNAVAEHLMRLENARKSKSVVGSKGKEGERCET